MIGKPRHLLSLFLALVLLTCTQAGSDGERLDTDGAGGVANQRGSAVHVPLPTPFLAGYGSDRGGEILTYHSPIPSVTTSLLVRSEDRSRSIRWESQPVPEDFQGDTAIFAIMLGIDVNAEPRQFDLLVNGQEALTISNPLEAQRGDTLRWEGSGVRGEFHITLMDRYGDAMGFLFLEVPGKYWKPGQPVAFEVKGESAGARTWFMVFRDPMRARISMQNAPAVLRTQEGEVQALRIDLLSLDSRKQFRLMSPVGQVDTILPLGHSRITLPVPAVASPEPVLLDVQFGEYRDTVSYTLQPPRRVEIHLLHHTHLDIGYTHHQDEVERIQWASLEEALRLGEASEEFPEGARFVWNPEGIWPVDSYVRAHPGEKTDRLMEGIRRGWIELDGMYAGLLTGLANEETLLHAFDAGRSLAEASGVPIESEMVSDIPGFSWGLVEALARNGIRYLSIGPNFGHRIGHLTEELGDRPFYWEGPSGENRVLTWVSGGGYAWFHTGLGFDSITALLDEEKVFQYVDQLEATEYPYDITYLRYNIGSDNGPPDPGLAQAVRDWNERFASPTLRISGTTEAFRRFEERYGRDLPTLRGDMTGHWEDGAASSARETSLVRRVAEALPQTETLAEMRGVALNQDLLEEAWRQVLLYYEHTWGSWNSISEPYSDLTQTSWDRKREFADAAVEIAGRLRDQALGVDPKVEDGPPAPNEEGGGVVEVYNTLAWDRSALVILGGEVSGGGNRVIDPDTGGDVPAQRLSTGELAFLASDVPARAVKSYRLVEDEGVPAERGVNLHRGPDGGVANLSVETSLLRLTLDGESGAVRSLLHRPSGRELVSEEGGGLNRYRYVPGRNPSEVVTNGSAEVRVMEAGPLVWTVGVTSPATGLRGPLRSRVRLVEGLDYVQITNSLPKAWVLEPEAVLFEFPFSLDDPEVWIDAPFAPYRPEVDQLPGASKNYFSAQRWVDLSDPDVGVTFATVDVPLVQLGEIRTDPIVSGWLRSIEPSSTLFSYVMNNYWETNYRAAQDDDVEVGYALWVHGPYAAEAVERFGLEQARPLIYRVVRP